MNAQICRKSDEWSFRKKTTTKHFENIQNAVLRNRAPQNERTNIYNNSKSQFGHQPHQLYIYDTKYICVYITQSIYIYICLYTHTHIYIFIYIYICMYIHRHISAVMIHVSHK